MICCCVSAMQGVIELLGSIHIIQTPAESRKPTRVGVALTQVWLPLSHRLMFHKTALVHTPTNRRLSGSVCASASANRSGSLRSCV